MSESERLKAKRLKAMKEKSGIEERMNDGGVGPHIQMFLEHHYQPSSTEPRPAIT